MPPCLIYYKAYVIEENCTFWLLQYLEVIVCAH